MIPYTVPVPVSLCAMYNGAQHSSALICCGIAAAVANGVSQRVVLVLLDSLREVDAPAVECSIYRSGSISGPPFALTVTTLGEVANIESQFIWIPAMAMAMAMARGLGSMRTLSSSHSHSHHPCCGRGSHAVAAAKAPLEPFGGKPMTERFA